MDAFDRLVAQEEIGQLVARYAVAYDARNQAELAALYAPGVAVEPPPAGRTFHLTATPVVTFTGDDTATGVVLCRAESEVGDEWIVAGLRYDDRYVRVGGRWAFADRQVETSYAADVLARPR